MIIIRDIVNFMFVYNIRTGLVKFLILLFKVIVGGVRVGREESREVD